MGGRTSDLVTLSVQGSAGVLDLVVPADADAGEVAAAYAAGAGLAVTPALHRVGGRPLAASTSLAEAGVGPGHVLVALLPGEGGTGSHRARGRSEPGLRAHQPGGGAVRWAALWCVLAGVSAALAGWWAAHAGSGPVRTATVGVLVVGAAVAVVPVGASARPRTLVAPVFGAAAAFALGWDATPERVPSVVGAAALVAAVVAAVARAVGARDEEALRTWTGVGVGVFATTALGALAGASPQVVWAVLVVVAVLAARWVPAWAVDVPDQQLVDLERLAVTAWSARDRPPGRRRRAVVHAEEIADVAARASRTVAAAAAAVLAVVALAAPLLLATATAPLDRIGARVLVAAAGITLLLAARSYRHRAARALLRAAGLVSVGALVAHLLPLVGAAWEAALAAAAVGGGLVVVVVAVATGRGWRSAWWSRRAEVLEALSGSVTVASLVVSSGLFRVLWERTY